MSTEKEKLFRKLSDAVVEMNEDEVIHLSHEVIAKKIDAYEAVEQGSEVYMAK